MSAAPQLAINTVHELVETLRSVQRSEYSAVLDKMHLSFAELANYCMWNDRRYTRNCIARTSEFELLLVCYEPGQRTSIHDYDTEEAWIKPVLGTVLEERFHLVENGGIELMRSAQLCIGSVTHLSHGSSIHRYTNTSGGRAATLNLYARPLLKWKVYEERA